VVSTFFHPANRPIEFLKSFFGDFFINSVRVKGLGLGLELGLELGLRLGLGLGVRVGVGFGLVTWPFNTSSIFRK
jgi:hypothetical protein